MSSQYPQLPPSGIGEAAKNNFSPWFIKLRFDDKSPIEGRRWKEATKPVSTLQTTIGNEFEDKVYGYLEDGASRTVDSWYDWDDPRNEEQIIEEVEKLNRSSSDRPVMMTQVRLSGEIGAFEVSGDADLVLLFPTKSGVKVHVIDIKSSWEEKPSQQLQAATYSILTRNALSSCDVDCTFTAGILFRETRLDSVLTEEETPSFHVNTREGDVHRILRENGPFTRAFDNGFEDLPLTIERNSPYAEVTAVQSLESNDLSLLDISLGEQQKLKNEGVETVEDIARLYDKVEEPKPYEYDKPSVNTEFTDTVKTLQESSSLSERLPVLSQKSQSFLGVIDPDNSFAHDEPWFPWIKGTGSGVLPEDDPPYQTNDLPVQRNSLIRVYMNVQYDHVRDSVVSVSGRLDCGRYDGSPLTFSKTIDEINRNPATWNGEAERELIQEVSSDLFNAIQLIADISGVAPRVAPHLYFYGKTEHEEFYEAVKRHEGSSREVESLRYLLDRRDGIDQQMVSVVEEEVSERMAPNSFDLSIQSVLEKMYCNDENAEFADSDWTFKHETGETVDSSEAFRTGMFDAYMPISRTEDGVNVLNKNGDNSNPDDFYRVVLRNGSQIPIEYLWASRDIDVLDTSWTDDSRQKSLIEDYMWVDSDEKSIRMTSSMFGVMSRKLCHVLHHIERSISYRNTDIDKEPLNMHEFEGFSSDEGTLADSCIEYLDLEAKESENEAFEVYSEPLQRRIIKGESVPVMITEKLRDEGYMFRVEAEPLFDEFGFENPERVAGSTKLSGSDGTTGGSRCVGTPLVNTSEGYEVAVDSPKEIATSVKMSVETYEPENNKVVLEGYRMSSSLDYEYVRARPPWTLDPSERRKQYVGPGEAFVLDPNPDNMMAEKSLKSLRHASSNPVYRDIEEMRSQKRTPEDSKFSTENANEYLDWCEGAVRFTPNQKQSDFICQTAKYSLLQGPPGTGKTSGALVHSIMARAYDMQQEGSQLTGLVTGLSNKSVNEVLDDMAELKQTFDDAYQNHELENLRLIRLSYDEPMDSPECVEYMNYQNDKDSEILSDILSVSQDSRQQQLTSHGSAAEHVIIFATPGRIDGLVGNLDEDVSAEDMYEDSVDIFDMVALDEASMMPLNQLFMTTAFVKPEAQIMLAGDQRQLPPVRQYEWSEEDRKSILRYVPHLSSLDYLRYLRGEDVDEVYDETPLSPKVNIPITRLERTYRCHKVVTGFLRDTIYRRDDIEYDSDQTDTLSQIDTDVDAVEETMNPEMPLTVIVHDDRTSQQVNVPEIDMLRGLVDSVSEDESVGIVTPHNAQKGSIKSILSRGDVDTVERFQGGEKDSMFLSTTVSDPSHLADEEDFILSENRLNVALSRMKKKLVVIVPETVFEMVPDEVETYDDAIIWKALYSEVNADGTPDWSGRLSDFSDGTSYDDVQVKVYHSNRHS